MKHLEGEFEGVKRFKIYYQAWLDNITSTVSERFINERISSTQEGSPMTAYGSVLIPKGNLTEVTLWAEFEKEENEKMLLKAGEIYLNSLKKYSEYVEQGEDPSKYDKKKK